MASEAIFIGYRRDDTADVAGRIYDALALRFGRQRIFKDVDNIAPGVDFGDHIRGLFPRCRVALILIGPRWLNAMHESGTRRIDDDHDLVRIEIETALASPGVLVVPVLVSGARMPRGDELPGSLRPLLRRNAAVIRPDPDFHDDVERLSIALRASVNTGFPSTGRESSPRAGREGRTSLVIGGAVALLVALVAVSLAAWRWLPTQTEQAMTRSSVTESAPQKPPEVEPRSQGVSLSRETSHPPSTTGMAATSPEQAPGRGTMEEQERDEPQEQDTAAAQGDSLDEHILAAQTPAPTTQPEHRLLPGTWRPVARRGGCVNRMEVEEATPSLLRIRLSPAALVANTFRTEAAYPDRIVYRESSFHLGTAVRWTWVPADGHLIMSYPDAECTFVLE